MRRGISLEPFLLEGNRKGSSKHGASAFLADLRSHCQAAHTQPPRPLPLHRLAHCLRGQGLAWRKPLTQTRQVMGGCKLLEMHLVFIWGYLLHELWTGR